jgi:hypothetical protein
MTEREVAEAEAWRREQARLEALEYPCTYCGEREGAGAAGLCMECNDLADERGENDPPATTWRVRMSTAGGPQLWIFEGGEPTNIIEPDLGHPVVQFSWRETWLRVLDLAVQVEGRS